jgi:glycosyltransferase involved in cell wall biosynthesis
MDQHIFPPKVSIVITTYNRAYCISDAIQSALDQTLPVAEVLIIDDGSTDNTAEVVESFHSDKLRYVKKENGGLADARNRGVAEAAGDFIIWLDDDDLLLPYMHEVYIATLSKDPNIDIVYGDYRFVDADGKILYDLEHDEFYQNNAFYISRLLMGLRVPHGGSMFHKSVYEKYGLYDPSFDSVDDYDLFIRIARHVSLKHVDSIVYIYKRHDENMSSERQISDRIPERRLVKKAVEMFSLKELFPDLDWNNEDAGRAEAHINIADLFTKYNDYNSAYEHMKQGIELLEKGGQTHQEDLCGVYISMGNIHLHREEYLSALDCFDKSFAIRETDRACYKLALVHNKLGDYETAEHYYRKTLELMPEHKAARAELDDLLALSKTNIFI